MGLFPRDLVHSIIAHVTFLGVAAGTKSTSGQFRPLTCASRKRDCAFTISCLRLSSFAFVFFFCFFSVFLSGTSHLRSNLFILRFPFVDLQLTSSVLKLPLSAVAHYTGGSTFDNDPSSIRLDWP